jgi:uncharacterized protein
MFDRLPHEIDPVRLADEGVRIEGQLAGESLARLRALRHPGTVPEPVLVQLEFERTAHGVRLLRGTFRTQLVVTCQRCLGPLTLALEAHPLLVLLAPDEASPTADEEAETLVVEGPVSLAELVEEELLLAMPMFPVHRDGECTAPGSKPEPEPASAPDARNPFAALGALKGKD